MNHPFEEKTIETAMTPIGDAVAVTRSESAAEKTATRMVERHHALSSQAVDRVGLVSSRHQQVVWSDIAEQELSRARQNERDAQLEQFQDRFHGLLIRHLEVLDELVKASQRRAEEQAERVRRRVQLAADATVSGQLLTSLEMALRRRIDYRERLIRELQNHSTDGK
jgi:hypothetical protein